MSHGKLEKKIIINHQTPVQTLRKSPFLSETNDSVKNNNSAISTGALPVDILCFMCITNNFMSYGMHSS